GSHPNGSDHARRGRCVELERGAKKNFGAKQARGEDKAAQKTRRALVPVPEFVEPELATLDTDVPAGGGWLHEAKYDGYRIIGRKADDEVTLFSRSSLDWTVRFPAVAEARATFPAEGALVRGRGA